MDHVVTLGDVLIGAGIVFGFLVLVGLIGWFISSIDFSK